MPSARRWMQFLLGAGGFVATGALFVKYGTPSDEQILAEMSPEVRGRYEREKRFRAKAAEILNRKITESVDKPAWLQGSGAMQKLDRDISREAIALIEQEDRELANAEEARRLRELQLLEKKR